MSVQAISWAYDQQNISTTAKFILVTLANYADQDWKCWPSIERLMRDTGLGKTSLISNVRKLKEEGYIKKRARGDIGTGRKSNVYYIQRSKSSHSEPIAISSHSEPSRKVHEVNPISSPGEPKPSLIHQGRVSDKQPKVDTKGLDAKTQALITHLLFHKFKEHQIATMVPAIQLWGSRGLKTEDVDMLMEDLKARGKMEVAPQYLDRMVGDLLAGKFTPAWAKVPNLEGSALMKWAVENGYPASKTETEREYKMKLKALARRRMEAYR